MIKVLKRRNIMKTFVPMTKDQLPQQRLYEVVDLPERPENLNIQVDWMNPLQKKRPKGSPRKLIYLCGVEWAWSPAHSRMDHYYLNLKPDQHEYKVMGLSSYGKPIYKDSIDSNLKYKNFNNLFKDI